MQDPYKIARFGLIRHAQTVWNREKKIQGHSDSPLTPEGEISGIGRWGMILNQIPMGIVFLPVTLAALWQQPR